MKDISPWRIERIDDFKDGGPEYVYNSAAEQETHLRDYWKIVVKRRRLFTVVFLLIMGIGSYFTLTAPTLYTATSLLRIDPQNPSAITGMGEIWNVTELSADYYLTQFALLNSRRLAAKVIEDLKLVSNDDFTKIATMSLGVRSRILGSLQYAISFIVPKATVKPISNRKTPDTEQDADQQLIDVNTSRWIGPYLGLLDVNPVKGAR